jgi:hypothetical protein
MDLLVVLIGVIIFLGLLALAGTRLDSSKVAHRKGQVSSLRNVMRPRR